MTETVNSKMHEEKVGASARNIEQEEETMREEMQVRMISEFSIQFVYNDGKEEDLDQINQMLAALELSDITVEDLSVYLCTTKKYEHDVVVDTAYRCGLSKGTLICKRADDEATYRYQIATEVLEDDALEDMSFANYWQKKYPARRLKMVIAYKFGVRKAFVVVYF